MTKNLFSILTITALMGCNSGVGVNQELNLSQRNQRVLLCHVPPGNIGNAHTIYIGEPALTYHFANHSEDHFGECSCEDFLNCDTGHSDTDNLPTDTGTFLETDTVYTDSLPTDSDLSTDLSTDLETDTDFSFNNPSDTDEILDSDLNTDNKNDIDLKDNIKNNQGRIWAQNGSNCSMFAPISSVGVLSLTTFILLRRQKRKDK